MKRCVITLGALAIFALLAAPVLAQGPKGKHKGPQRGSSEDGGRQGQRPNPEQIFKHLDKNGDGELTKEELPERVQEHFSKVDADGDGAISKEEFAEAHKKMGGRRPGGPGGPDPEQIFQRADKNGDGKLTKDEVPEQAWERLSKADADGDNAVTKEELREAMKNMQQRPGEGRQGRGPNKGRDPGQMFKRLDKNGDGSLSQDEVPAQFWQRIAPADANGDGVLSEEEIRKAMQQRGPRRRPEGGKKAEKR